MTESTFLTVERLGDDELWIPIATDADWETKYVQNDRTLLRPFNETCVV